MDEQPSVDTKGSQSVEGEGFGAGAVVERKKDGTSRTTLSARIADGPGASASVDGSGTPAGGPRSEEERLGVVKDIVALAATTLVTWTSALSAPSTGPIAHPAQPALIQNDASLPESMLTMIRAETKARARHCLGAFSHLFARLRGGLFWAMEAFDLNPGRSLARGTWVILVGLLGCLVRNALGA
ncbi:MAG: hypothetical protein SFW67_34280 [Myxococcaceae bacterium]|nr:hypothetical protein [Myxococcaceae bacterium]